MAEAGSVWVSVLPSLRGFTQKVKTELRDLGVEVSLNVDTRGARAKIAEATRGSTADVKVKVDEKDARAKLGSVAGDIAGLTTKVGLFGAAGAIGLGAVGAGAGAAAGALGLLVGPIAAAKLGADGLKASFTQLNPQVDALKGKVSAAFQQGMQPAVDNLRTLLPGLSGGLVGVAGGMSEVAEQATGAVASSAGLANINGVLTGTHTLLTSLAPALGTLTSGFLTASNAGLQGLQPLGGVLQGFSTQLALMFQSLSQAGVVQAGVSGLVQVLGAVMGFLPPLIGLGLQLMAVLGPPLAQALTVLQGVMAPLGSALLALAPVAGVLANVLAQVLLVAVQALAPIIAALAPLASMLAQVLGATLVAAVQALAQPLLIVAQVLTATLMPILPMIAGLFGQLAATLGTILVQALTMIAPLLPMIASAFMSVVAALLPLVPLALQFVTQVVAALLPIVPLLVGVFLQLVAAVLPLIPPLIQLVSFVLPILASVIGFLVPIIGFLANMLGSVLVGAVQIVAGVITGLISAVQGVGGFFTWLWQSVIVPAWTAISSAVSTAWTSVIQPVLSAVGTALGYVGLVVGTLLLAPFVIAWNAISALVSAVWTGILQPIWVGAIVPALQFLGSVFTWLWQNVVTPVWNGIVAAIQAAWSVIQAIWNGAVVPALRFLGSVFDWLWRNVIVPVWNGIVTAIQDAWGVVASIFNAVVNFLRAVLGPVFQWLYNNVIRPVWDGIVVVIRGAWDFIKGIFDVGMRAVDAVGRAFQSVADWIGRSWAAIKEHARAPVQFVVDVVYNNGIRKVWNGIAGLFGMAQLPEVRFAGGGVLPGYTPGRDIIPAMLSGGEGILVPEAVRALGPGFVGWANRTFSGGRSDGGTGTRGYSRGGVAHFADGGVLGGIGDFFSAAGDFLTDIFTDPASAVRKAFAGVLGDAGRTPGAGGWTDSLKRMPGKVIDAVIAKAKSFIESLMSMGGGGGAGVQRWSGVVLQALAMLGQPAGLLPVVLRRMNQESGGNPTIVNRTDSNWVRGTPSVGLMQVIGPTFAAYAGALRGIGPFLYGTSVNPLANIYASMRYAMARYGSLAAAYNKAGGYDSGGIASGSGFLAKQVISPERVLSPRQTAAFESLVPLLSTMQRRGVGIGTGVYDGMPGALSGGPVIGTVNQQLPDGVSSRRMVEELTFELRRNSVARGVHSR